MQDVWCGVVCRQASWLCSALAALLYAVPCPATPTHPLRSALLLLPAHPPAHRAPPRTGQEALLAALEEVVEPAARRFRPDILLVSAGYDAHWRDPLGGAARRGVVWVQLVLRARC